MLLTISSVRLNSVIIFSRRRFLLPLYPHSSSLAPLLQRPVEAPVLSFNKAAFVPDKASRRRSSVRRKIPACRSTERCPEGILSLRRQSQIPTEIDGLLASLCGEPFSRERWLLSFPTNTYDSRLGSETNTQIQGRESASY